MLDETARRCVLGIGLGAEQAERVAALLEEGRKREARQRLRVLRCALMEELHSCQSRVDRLDWLIRETEKEENEPARKEGRKS